MTKILFILSKNLWLTNTFLWLFISIQAQSPAKQKNQNFTYNTQQIQLKNFPAFKINILKGYRINVAAQGLKRLRFLANSPDGRLFATDMYDRSDNQKGRVLIFDRWNEKQKRFDTVITYLNGLHNPNQVAFYDNYIYIAETDKLSRINYKTGDNSPSGNLQTIAEFPSYGLSYKYGGWHLTRSILFFKNKLYVSIGSSCNACIEKEDIRATIVEMNPDGSHQRIFARGLRNAVGLTVANNQIWVTNMGRDLIGPEMPEDLLHPVTENGFYGWPFYLQYQGKILPDKEFSDSIKGSFVTKPPLAPVGFKAHTAPLGVAYLRQFDDELLNNGFLVCLHGSTSVWRQRGNSIVFTKGKNNYVEILSGFLQGKTERERYGRPCGILQQNNRALFFTDDKNGVLYYLWKE